MYKFRFKKIASRKKGKALLILDGHGSQSKYRSDRLFFRTYGIELVCIPPHSSHRLQPLDTHFNKPLKSKWSNDVDAFLKANDKVILTKFDFFNPFSSTWEHMANQRGLIVNSFQHCGIYPIERRSEIEFSKAAAFEESVDNRTFNQHPTQCLRLLMPSPKNKFNEKHLSSHNSCDITNSSGNIAKQEDNSARILKIWNFLYKN